MVKRYSVTENIYEGIKAGAFMVVVDAADYHEAIKALRLLLAEMELSGNAGSKDYGWPAAVTASRAVIAKEDSAAQNEVGK